MSSPLRRVTASAVSAVLVTSGALVAASSPAQAAPTDVAADAAGSWLAGQLGSDGLLPGPSADFPGDVGLSIDAGFSLAEVGSNVAVGRIVQAVQGAKGEGYVQSTYPDGAVQVVNWSANGTAKALAFLESQNTATNSVGSVSAVTRLQDLTTDSGASAGRIVDLVTRDGAAQPPVGSDGTSTTRNDYANTLGQAFAARGLAAAGSTEAPAALDYLLLQQCPAGGFRLEMAEATATTALGCATDTPATNDVTAIVVQQLAALGSSDADAVAALAKARTWLSGRQAADGSWTGDGTIGANANSTGLAARAVAPTDAAAATRAATWLRSLQATAFDACTDLNRERGVIGYDAATLKKARTDGIGTTAADRDVFQRVAAQALPALAALDQSVIGAAPKIAAPQSYQRAGGDVRVRLGGFTAGEGFCLVGPGNKILRNASSTTFVREVALPRGTARRTYSVVDRQGNIDRATVRVLGPTRLSTVASTSRAKRGQTIATTVRGLAPGERVAVFLGGDLKARGTASARGNFVARYSVGRSVGVKQVVARAKFGDIRRGTDAVRVVR